MPWPVGETLVLSFCESGGGKTYPSPDVAILSGGSPYTSDLITDGASLTGATLTSSGAFGTTGPHFGNDALSFSPYISSDSLYDGWYVGSGDTLALTFTNLPAGLYDIVYAASRNVASTDTTRICTVEITTGTLAGTNPQTFSAANPASGSVAPHVTFGSVAPVGGVIVISVTTPATFAYLNAIAITALPTASEVTADSTLQWSILKTVTADSDLRWAVLQSLQKDLTAQWDIRQGITADIDVRWNILQLINADADLRWSVIQEIFRDLELRWDADGSLSTVQSDLTLQWSIIAAIAQSLQMDWSILQSVTGDADVRWSVLAAATKDLTAQWNVLQAIEAGATLQWDVIGTAEKSLTLRWSIESDTQFPDITGTITINTATPRITIASATPVITIH